MILIIRPSDVWICPERAVLNILSQTQCIILSESLSQALFPVGAKRIWSLGKCVPFGAQSLWFFVLRLLLSSCSFQYKIESCPFNFGGFIFYNSSILNSLAQKHCTKSLEEKSMVFSPESGAAGYWFCEGLPEVYPQQGHSHYCMEDPVMKRWSGLLSKRGTPGIRGDF